ncbi:MAG: acyl-CoA dehydrogenase family protein [Deltaproteobacteria bacterium]|nr:acyl-CoA dehydrogenase family protein [Deltaproteobacteria bacterium]
MSDGPLAVDYTPVGPGAARLRAIVRRARGFADRHLRPVALGLERRLEREHDHFPWDVVRAGADDGWLGGVVPSAWGGQGLGIVDMSVAMEELCAGDAGLANIFGAHALGMLPLLLGGQLDLARRVLGEVTAAARGPAPQLCAFAITEPGGGSDVEEADGLARGAVHSHAVRGLDGYRLHGRKVFISNGNVAEWVVVFVAVERQRPLPSWTAFVVRRGTPGMSCPRLERKLGQRACPAAELLWDDAVVPAAQRIGAEGSGWELSRRVLAISRGPVGAIATGLAREAFTVALQATRGRREPWMEDALARMAVSIRVARAAYLEAAQHADEVLLPGPLAQRALALAPGPLGLGGRLLGAALARRERAPETAAAWARQVVLGATAKLTGSDAAMAAATVALDLVPPGAGVLRARAEKAFRDAKLTQIYEGTNQINLRAIAHEGWPGG